MKYYTSKDIVSTTVDGLGNAQINLADGSRIDLNPADPQTDEVGASVEVAQKEWAITIKEEKLRDMYTGPQGAADDDWETEDEREEGQ